MNKSGFLFKFVEGIVIVLIGFIIFQFLFRIYVIFITTRVLHGNESLRSQFSFITEELKMENLAAYVVFITYFILLSGWFYIKYKKAHSISHLRFTYKPIWALFSFIIPIFNLVAPYKIMNELWTVQNKDMSIELIGKNMIKTWWILSIIVFIVSRYLNFKAGHASDLETFLSLEYIFLFYYAVLLHYFLLTLKLLRMIR